jgi:broad-specificity NMP kinase
MIIEFVGLPGSGKTTLYRRARQMLDNAGFQLWTPYRLWTNDVATLAPPGHARKNGATPRKLSHMPRLSRVATRLQDLRANRVLVRWVLARILSSKQPWKYKAYAARLFLTSLADRCFAQRRSVPDEIVLFPEGVVHRGLSVFMHSSKAVNVEAIRHYVSAIPLPDVLIVLQADPNIVLERTRARRNGTSRRMRLNSESDMLEGERVLNAITSELRSYASVHMVTLNTDDLTLATFEFEAQVMPDLLTRWQRMKNVDQSQMSTVEEISG